LTPLNFIVITYEGKTSFRKQCINAAKFIEKRERRKEE
jgi:hypothetical protein